MAANMSDPGVAHMVTSAGAFLETLLETTEALYLAWESDAAFYTLRAAAEVALTPDHVLRVRTVAVRRRDEYLTADEGVTAANHGSRTTDAADRARGYLDSYAALVDEIDQTIDSRLHPPLEGGTAFWSEYGWSPQG